MPAPQPIPAPVSTPKKDDDDPPFSLQWGFGGSGPLWSSRSLSGKYLKPDKLEVDQKTEVDFTFPSLFALGDGHLKLQIGAEYDTPLDNDHLGKSTVAANLQLQADDFYKSKNDLLSLSPFIKGTYQWQQNGNATQQSAVLKGGLELDVNLSKNTKLEADVNSGVQLPGFNNDKDTTAKAIVPLEGNLNFVLNF